MSQEALDQMLEGERRRCQDNYITLDRFLVDPSNPDVDGMRNKIRERSWDVVAIGYGVRASQAWTGVFELMVNMAAQEGKSVPKFAFNLMPNQVLEAVMRVSSDMAVTEQVEIKADQAKVDT